ncbi:MAG: glycogen debranching protein [Candidatus Kerfeldbacteria bacterium]|nr:glycogen debranching protein [Candidatus Kerfeldbacteria bacterium]
MNLIAQARVEATRVLRDCTHPLGIKASARPSEHYQVWARDSMIAALGALFVDDARLQTAIRSSIAALATFQTPLGLIPNNVSVETRRPNYTAGADSGLWYVIGITAVAERHRDRAFLRRLWPSVTKTLDWYAHQDVDQSGLIHMREGADWEDQFAVRDKALTLNVLYAAALARASRWARQLGQAARARSYRALSTGVKRQVNDFLWYTPDQDLSAIIQRSYFNRFVSGKDRLGRKLILPKKTILRAASYYLPYVTFKDFGEWFDTLGNLLAILTGVASPLQGKAILAFIERRGLAKPFPIRAIDPPIHPNQKDWRYYYRFGNLNLPHQYHNGGIWPFIGGFYVAALVKAGRMVEAKRELAQLAELNRRGKTVEWEFNEWFHGQTGEPRGFVEQAWSAGMFLYADEAVRSGAVRFLS